MAEITRKRTGELIRGIFQILMDHPNGLPAKQILEQLETIVPPNDFERSTYPKRPGVRRYENVARFSTIGPVKAGWLRKDKGLWILTDEGRLAFEKFKDPLQLANESERLYREWKLQQPDAAIEEAIGAASPDASTTLEEAEEASWTEVEEHLKGIAPYDFQNLVAGLLKGIGYHVVWVAPPGPDGGIDIIAYTDPLGVTGPRIKVQVKRSDERIAVKDIRSFLAVLSEGDVGLFIATGGFTRDAEAEAQRQEKRRSC